MAGNTLGPRGWFQYISDSGDVYGILTDVDLAEAAGLNPLTASAPSLPRRFKPRVILLEAVEGGRKIRKELVIGSAQDPDYATESSANFQVDGVTFTSTGRRGEQVSYPRLQSTVQ